MANRKKYLGAPGHGLFSKPTTEISNMHGTPSDSAFELQELDLYSSAVVEETRVQPCSSKVGEGRSDPSSSSLPINVPDWSKILGKQYSRPNRGRLYEVDDQVEDGGLMVPPHEFLAKTRRASMSVQEGIGRTLKGRDLSRVRNFVWAKTGFQD